MVVFVIWLDLSYDVGRNPKKLARANLRSKRGENSQVDASCDEIVRLETGESPGNSHDAS